MEPFPLQEAAEALKARIIGGVDGNITGICTDTRQGAQGALFFALIGENGDGHRFVSQAFAQGAVAAVVDREIPDASGTLLIVPDTTIALGDLANHYRRKFNIPVVGVTGSVGKTSTKEMVAQALRTRLNTLANEKNYNNEIGVPLTLFQLTRAHEVAVVEMGMRGMGQIDRLAEIAEPTVAVITNIGHAHVELLGSRDAIAEAKSELLTRLPANGFAILPRHDPYYSYLMGRVPEGVSVITYGIGKGQDAPDVMAQVDATGKTAFISIYEKMFALNLQVAGSHHLHNAAAVMAVASALNVPLRVAADALENWEGAEGRMTVVRTPDGLTVLDDCYNAGPESMEAALRTLSLTDAKRCVAVLGDMRELGEFAPQLHRQVGHRVVEDGVNLLLTVGELAQEIASESVRYAQATGSAAPEIESFLDTSAVVTAIHTLVQPGDAVLIKGSRAMQMEAIVTALTGQESPNRHA